MIDSICTPCRVSKTSDLKVRLDLLKEIKGRFPTGLEVVGTISDFIDPVNRKIITDNLAAAKESGLNRVTIHSPLERKDYGSNRTNLSQPEGLETLKAVFDLANQVEAKVVTVHCEIFHSLEGVRNLTEKERERLKEAVAENLSRLDRGQVSLGIENMPYPLMGDVFFSSANMVYDPLFADPLELYQFVKKEDLQITFDTCHWATLCLPIPLLDIFQKIEDRVCEIHLSDAYGQWLEGTTIFEEGLIPGEGNLGKDNFHRLLSYLKESKKSLILNLEVKDRDYENQEESRESLSRVLNWLKD